MGQLNLSPVSLSQDAFPFHLCVVCGKASRAHGDESALRLACASLPFFWELDFSGCLGEKNRAALFGQPLVSSKASSQQPLCEKKGGRSEGDHSTTYECRRCMLRCSGAARCKMRIQILGQWPAGKQVRSSKGRNPCLGSHAPAARPSVTSLLLLLALQLHLGVHSHTLS